MIVSAIGQGMLWALLGLGIFMTYRILNFPDMTTEGSFPLGGAVCVTAITTGVSPFVATLLGVGAGMLAGLVTGLLFTKGKIPIILAGILVMSGLNSVILFVMKSPNKSLLNQPKIQDVFQKMALPDYYDTIFLGISVLAVVMILLLFFFNTSLGQAYIATGDNEEMARSIGIQTDRMKILGLVLSNGLIGLASLIIGEVLFGELTFGERLMAIVVGSIIYQLLILLVIKLGFDTTYLKIFSAVILAICLMIPQLKKALRLHGFSDKGETK